MGREDRNKTAATIVSRLRGHPVDEVSPDGDTEVPESELVLSEVQLDRLKERFAVKRLLGTGGMGIVVEVHDIVLQRDVAVKLLYSSDEDARTRFLREARAAGTLHHPGIVTVHDVDPAGGFIVMELVTGGSLADRLKREPRLDPAEVRRIAAALLSALGEAHDAGIIHRDVKPANVLFDDEHGVKLADFGVASFGDSQLTSTGVRIGTPDYMAPEQLRGRTCDSRADIYAAGATLFEAATGAKLHHDDGRTRDPARDVRAATGDERLARAIARAVEDRASDRFASAAEFAAALDAARPGRRTRGIAFAVAGALALCAAAFAIATRSREPAAKPTIAPVAVGSGVGREIELERLLQLGVTAVEDNDLETASRLLLEVVAREPDLAEAYHYLALVLEWQGKPVGEIMAAIEKGLAGKGLDPAQRSFLDGFKLLVQRRDHEALAFFTTAAERYPNDRGILYGLFEAQFHSGDPDASVRTYRRLCELAKRFRLGIYHPLAYYIARADDAGTDWALAQADEASRHEWLPNALIARHRYADAIADLQRTIGAETVRTPTTAMIQLAEAYAISGQLDQAVTTVNQLADKDRTAAALPRWALRLARGESPGESRELALHAPPTNPVGITRLEAWLQLAMIAVVADPGSVRAIADGLEAARRDEPGEIIQADIGAAFLGGALADQPLTDRARRDGFAEAIAVADAFDAERRGQRDRELELWRHALASVSDGRYMVLEWYYLAATARALGDHAQTIAACREVIEPRVFVWSWGAAVGPCLLWTADAQRATGDPAARATYQRLIELRSRGGADDALVRAATAARGP